MAHRTRSFVVEHFAHIERAEIEFGDVTIVVGPQAAGKSLLLQLWKLALDHRTVRSSIEEAGYDATNADEFLEVYLGQGMSKAWRSASRLEIDGKPTNVEGLLKSKAGPEGVFYIPAHRALLLAEGWPAPFLKLNADHPAVARQFSQELYEIFANPRNEQLFPMERKLKGEIRASIDRSVYHGAKVRVGRDGPRKRLELGFADDSAGLPFMTWSSGQREFTPLLLGLYHLLPERMLPKRADIDWVVIEEPEMGLHPEAIRTVMLLVLELRHRGYKVILSTHAPLVLDVAWAVAALRSHGADPRLLADAFGVESPDGKFLEVMNSAIKSSFRVHLMKHAGAESRVVSKEITDLDPSSDDPDLRGWGGLTGLSGGFGDVVARAVASASS